MQTNEVKTGKGNAPCVKRALQNMVNVFNVETIDPTAAFVAIEQAKGAIEQANKPPVQTVAQTLAGAIGARLNCIQSGNDEWRAKWEQLIARIEKEQLPSGSGIDRGTRVDLEKSTGDKLVLCAGFHHMNESGMYDGWTDHVITITPAFRGVDVAIGGRNRNEIKEYLSEVFHAAMAEDCEVAP